MINRYYGNTGRVVRMEEPEPLRRTGSAGAPLHRAESRAQGTPSHRAAPGAQGPSHRAAPGAQGPSHRAAHGTQGAPQHGAQSRTQAKAQGTQPHAPNSSKQKAQKPPLGGLLGGTFDGVFDGIGGIMSRVTNHLETEDIILLIMLYLFYRESGDNEWLIIMGALLFM